MTSNWQNTSAQNETGKASLDFEKYFAQISYSTAACTVTSIIGNTLVILIVCRHKKMRTTPNLLAVNMAVANILRSSTLLAVTILISSIRIDLTTIKRFQEKHWTLVAYFSDALYINAMESLTVVSVHRFYAVIFPMRARLENRKNCFVAIVFTWMFAFALPSPTLFELSYSQVHVYKVVNAVLTLPLPIFIMFCLYSIVIVKLWRQKIPGDPSTILIRERRKQNITLTAMFINLVMVFCLTNGTALILILIFAAEIETTNLAVTVKTLFLVYEVTNPLIFFIYCRNYRQGLKDLFNCCHKISTAETRSADACNIISTAKTRSNNGVLAME